MLFIRMTVTVCKHILLHVPHPQNNITSTVSSCFLCTCKQKAGVRRNELTFGSIGDEDRCLVGYGTLCGNVLVQLAASIFRVAEKNKVCARNGGVIKGKSGLGNWCNWPAGELFLWSSFGCGEHIRNKSQNAALGGRTR